MPALNRIFEVVGRHGDVSVDRAMAAALPTADPEAVVMIVRALLRRQHPEGTIGLVRSFDRLSPELQTLVVEQAAELYRPLREAADQKSGAAAINMIQIVRRAKAVRLLYLVIDALRHGAPPVREEAAACLLELSRALATSPDRAENPPCPGEEARFLVDAVQEAVSLYKHHHLLATLQALAELAPRPLVAASVLFYNARHAATEPMRMMLEAAETPAVCRLMLGLVRVPTVHGSVVRGLRRALENGNIAHVLPTTHLLLHAPTAAAIRHAPNPETLVNRLGDLSRFTPHQARGLARWIAAQELDAPRRVELLSHLVDLPDRLARFSAVRQLMFASVQGSQEANALIARFCFDREEALARLALRHLMRVKWDQLTALALKLVSSSHASVRELASAYVSRRGFERFWDAWPSLDDKQRLAAGRALLKIDPHFAQQIGQRLARRDTDTRLRAIAIIQTLGQAPLFEQALIELGNGPDKVVASAAVKALGSAPTPRAVQSLEAALDHEDARVRANAIEAIAQASATEQVQEKLVEMAEKDESNRPRANAIHALMDMRTADALAALAKMLADPEANQRVSALWVVESMGLIEVARHVADLAVADPDPQVRTRARDAVAHLIRIMTQPGTSEAGQERKAS